jgi:hypothetical protein
MTTNEIVLTTKKAMLIRIIASIGEGVNIKDACAMEKVSEKTFTALVKQFPDVSEALNNEINAQLGETLSKMVTAKKKNLEAIIEYTSTLRDRLEMNVLDDKAATMLMKADVYLDATIAKILPANQQVPVQQGDNADKIAANAVLASRQGAKRVHITRTVESYRVELGGETESASMEDIIEASPDAMALTSSIESTETSPEAASSAYPNLDSGSSD